MPRATRMPLQGVRGWNPFRIDALGLVTLLGAEEVNRNIGTLQRRRYTEFLPLLAAFIIAGNRFVDEQPGYCLYNITDGIQTTELKGWFTRWLSSQNIQNGTSIFRWHLRTEGDQSFRHAKKAQVVAPLLSVIAVAPLLVFAILIGDWFGVGDALAIIASIIVRKVLLWQLRNAVNDVALPREEEADELDEKKRPSLLPSYRRQSEKPLSPVSTTTKQLHRANSQPLPHDIVTLFITRADGRMVTMYAPRTLLQTFTRDVKLPHPRFYHFCRWLGWAAFGAHIVVLGMSTLFTQIYTVVLLVMSTWLLCHDFPRDSDKVREMKIENNKTINRITRSAFTSCISVIQEDPYPNDEKMDKRMWAYVRAQPTSKQEDMLKHWSMLPFDGVPWYDTYHEEKAKYKLRTTSLASSGDPPKNISPSVRSSSTSVGAGASPTSPMLPPPMMPSPVASKTF